MTRLIESSQKISIYKPQIIAGFIPAYPHLLYHPKIPPCIGSLGKKKGPYCDGPFFSTMNAPTLPNTPVFQLHSTTHTAAHTASSTTGTTCSATHKYLLLHYVINKNGNVQSLAFALNTRLLKRDKLSLVDPGKHCCAL